MNILRPLSPHLPIYKPQLTSTFPISHRISGALLATIVLFFYLLYLKMGLICFTYENFYQFLFYSSKLILIVATLTALALSYHLYNGVRHLLTTDFLLILLSYLVPILVFLGVNFVLEVRDLPIFLPIIIASCDDEEEGVASNSTLDIYRGRPPAREGGELMAAVQPFLRPNLVDNPADREGVAPQDPSQSSSSTSSESGNSYSMGEEGALNPSGGAEAEDAGAPIPAFRAAHHAEEAELYARISRLEGLLGHQIVERLEPGGYLREVKENLTSAAGVGESEYLRCLEFETFELSIGEDKLLVQDLLFELLLKEPNLSSLVEISPSRDKNIREEAYEFLEEQIKGIEPSSPSSHTERLLIRHFLKSRIDEIITDLRTHGMGSATYRRFHQFVEGT